MYHDTLSTINPNILSTSAITQLATFIQLSYFLTGMAPISRMGFIAPFAPGVLLECNQSL